MCEAHMQSFSMNFPVTVPRFFKDLRRRVKFMVGKYIMVHQYSVHSVLVRSRRTQWHDILSRPPRRHFQTLILNPQNIESAKYSARKHTKNIKNSVDHRKLLFWTKLRENYEEWLSAQIFWDIKRPENYYFCFHFSSVRILSSQT